MALAVRAMACPVMALITTIQKRRELLGGLHDDIATAAAIAASGSAERHVRFPTKRRRASSTITGLNIYGYFVDKARHRPALRFDRTRREGTLGPLNRSQLQGVSLIASECS